MNLVITLEHRLFGEQFQHNTPECTQSLVCQKDETPSEGLPCTPHIHLRPVNSRTKQQFWWTVPQGDHTICVICSPSLLVESCKTKISEFEFTTIIDKDIRALDITVNYTLVMEIRQASKHLITQ